MSRSALPVLLLAALSAGCGGTMDAVRRLEAFHDPKDFSHRPDLPATCDACLKEVGKLAAADYDDRRDAAGAIFLLARVATEDSAALHRLEACRALGRLGGILAGAEDPRKGAPPTEDETAAALAGIRRIHGSTEGRIHPDAAAAAACAALFHGVGDYRIPIPGDPGAAGLVRELRVLPGVLLGVLVESRDEDGMPGEAEADRAMVNLGAQVVRVALAGTVLHDGDPRVRGEAARAIGASPGAGLAEVLRTAFRREPDGSARRAMVRAAAAVAGRTRGSARDPAMSILFAALDDDDRGIRFEAREGLRTLAGEDFGASPGPWIRWWDGTRDNP